MCLLLLLRNDSREIYSLCVSDAREMLVWKTFWPTASEASICAWVNVDVVAVSCLISTFARGMLAC